MNLNEPEENYITGWIKLYRSFIKWEWFEVPNMVTVFIYCLLKANHMDNRWRGIEIKKGTFITSLKTMSKETGISTQSIRTCLKHLQNSGEINKQSNKEHTVITICKYASYQDFQESPNTPSNKPLTNHQQTANKPLTTNNNYNNYNNENNNVDGDFFMNELSNNKEVHGMYIEGLYMRHKLKPKSLGELIVQFNNQLKVDEKKHKSLEEYKNHFGNWMNTQETIRKLEDYKR